LADAELELGGPRIGGADILSGGAMVEDLAWARAACANNLTVSPRR